MKKINLLDIPDIPDISDIPIIKLSSLLQRTKLFMATITCAISGISFKSDYMTALNISYTEGYFHPVFAANHQQLHYLYSLHTSGKLSASDSYLTFLALLHSSGKIEWRHPATIDPTSKATRSLIENNIAQLVSVLAMTDAIKHPGFKQPRYTITHNNSDLEQVGFWIRAWQDNINSFHTYRAGLSDRKELAKIENYLSTLILSGEETKNYSHIVADWADIAADFPAAKREEWKRIIRTCFNVTKMFNTPLSSLKEIKDYCECNIEVGSIHFHTLSEVLKKGISCHVDYLGGSTLARGYELLPDLADSDTLEAMLANEKAVSDIIAKAPKEEPKKENYSSQLDYLKAKLAYRAARNAIKENELNKLGL